MSVLSEKSDVCVLLLDVSIFLLFYWILKLSCLLFSILFDERTYAYVILQYMRLFPSDEIVVVVIVWLSELQSVPPLQLIGRIQLMASYTSHVSPVLSGIRFAQSLVLCVVFSRSFSFGHCYGFCLPLWYLQTLPNPFLAIFITMFKNE